MKIAVCQIGSKVGNLEDNFAIIKSSYNKAQKENADLCIFPELSTSGYLAEDLFLNSSFIKDIQDITNELVALTTKTCLLLPTPILENGILYNGVIASSGGKIIGKTYKQELPNFGIFDEKRYFTSGQPQIISINGIKIGVPICEDVWHEDVCKNLKQQGAELLISPNGSPYENGKMDQRINSVKARFKETNLPIIYCNQILGQDGIIFDGRSFCYDGQTNIICKAFEEDFQIVEFTENKFLTGTQTHKTLTKNEEYYQAMILGTRDYVRNNGFSKVILGLSGGIDSAIVAAIAVEALGSENVSAFMLPSKFTSKESLEDAAELAKNLDITLETIEIQPSVDSLARSIKLDSEDSITYQNLQSRARGVILMAKSNETATLLLTTGNKSEYATGYATIYGDMNGAFNPIKDIYKSDLYELTKYINSVTNIFPERILSKEPTAELAADQKDSDSLPDYSILDKILYLHIEKDISASQLKKEFEAELVERIVKLVKNAEFKRKQSAPGVKLSTKNFEKDRRIPTTHAYTAF